MRKSKKKRKGFDGGSIRCPYCGSHTIYRSADGIYRDSDCGTMLYVCAHYPACDAYVRTHKGTRIPVGSLANRELRSLRKTAHHHFDRLYKNRYMTKEDAYCWLADTIDAPLSKAHIGYLSDYYCKIVIEESRKYLERINQRRKQKFNVNGRGGVLVS